MASSSGISSTSFCASSHESKSANCVRNGTITRPEEGTIEAASTVCPSVARFNSTPFRFARGSSEATAEATAEAAEARERMGTCLRREGRLDTGLRPATG